MKRVKSVRAMPRFGLAVALVLALGFAALELEEATACPLPKGALKKLVPVNAKFKTRSAAPQPVVGTSGVLLPAGVSMMPGFPRASATWCCGAALYYDVDDADSTQEALMPCTAECLDFDSPQIHRCYDSIWVIKSGGLNARNFPVTMTGHPCSCMAVADIDGDSKPEIAIGSDINPAFSAKYPDSRIYAFNSDGTAVSGFPKDVNRGPIPGGICMVDLDGWKVGGDNYPEVLFGTRGWYDLLQPPQAGKITAVNADGSYIAAWDKAPDDYHVTNSPAVGDLLGGQNFPGNEVVFFVNRFYTPGGQVQYVSQSRLIVFKRDGTQLATYDIGDVAGPSRASMSSAAIGKTVQDVVGPSPDSMSSPAIGKIVQYQDQNIISNIVVCSGPGTRCSPVADGKVCVLHLAPNGTRATIVLDWSVEASVQRCQSLGNEVPDKFTADPAIADLDNDGQNEIVALSDQGTLYVVDCFGTMFTITTATTATCGSGHFHGSSPLVFDIDATHTDMEIIVGTSPDIDRTPGYIFVYKYRQGAPLSKLYDIGPFSDKITMTPALGDIDGDNKTDIIVQALTGGLIYCFEFDNSTYSAAINSNGWPCMGRNAARTHCAD